MFSTLAIVSAPPWRVPTYQPNFCCVAPLLHRGHAPKWPWHHRASRELSELHHLGTFRASWVELHGLSWWTLQTTLGFVMMKHGVGISGPENAGTVQQCLTIILWAYPLTCLLKKWSGLTERPQGNEIKLHRKSQIIHLLSYHFMSSNIVSFIIIHSIS